MGNSYQALHARVMLNFRAFRLDHAQVWEIDGCEVSLCFGLTVCNTKGCVSWS